VSALIDYGLAESTVDALVQGDIGTVERVGSMTPEELEAIPGIDGQAVAHIQQAINAYYGQEYAAEAAAEEVPAGETPEEGALAEEAPAEETAGEETFEQQEGVETPVEPVTEIAAEEASSEASTPESSETAEDSSSGTIVKPAE
jgi:N utilization substance protein A